MKIENIKKGDRVRYIPTHADGDKNHKDCENGIISSWNNKVIFVRYYTYGTLQYTAHATDPGDLIFIHRDKEQP